MIKSSAVRGSKTTMSKSRGRVLTVAKLKGAMRASDYQKDASVRTTDLLSKIKEYNSIQEHIQNIESNIID